MKRRDFLGIAGGMAVVHAIGVSGLVRTRGRLRASHLKGSEGRMNRRPIGIGGIDMAKMDFNACTQY